MEKKINKKITLVHITKELKCIRLGQGLSIEDMAYRSGYTYQNIYNFERGKLNNLKLFLLYCLILNVTNINQDLISL